MSDNNTRRSNDDPVSEHPTASAESSGEPNPPSAERRIFTPPIDIYETESGLVLHADLPGVSADTLELQVQDNKLTLFGRVKQAVPDDAVTVHQEYEVGDFLRSFILSDDVDHEKISAKLNNGVLEVVLPRIEQGGPRRIRVRTE